MLIKISGTLTSLIFVIIFGPILGYIINKASSSPITQVNLGSIPKAKIDPFFSPKTITAVKNLKASKNCKNLSINNSEIKLLNCGVVNQYINNTSISVLPTYKKENGQINLVRSLLPINRQWIKNDENNIGNDITSNSVPLSELGKALKQEDWAKIPFNSATDIIAVGLASNEIVDGKTNKDGLLYEERRAGVRATNLYQQIYQAVPNVEKKNLYTLNLGKYKGGDACVDSSRDKLTGYQRPILIFSIVDKTGNVDRKYIEDALKEELIKFSTVKIDYKCYSKFDLDPLQH